MIVATAISLVLSIIAIAIAVRANSYTRRQTVLMEGQESRRQHEDETTIEWAKKFDQAVGKVLTIGPRSFTNSIGMAYHYIFPDTDLRRRIETYLIISTDPTHRNDSARQLSGELLRMAIVQQTIREVLDRIDQFRHTEPDNWKKLGLG